MEINAADQILFFGFGGQFTGLVNSDAHRFFADHMDVMVHGIHSNLEMCIVWRTDVYRIQFHYVYHFFIIRKIMGYVKLFCGFFCVKSVGKRCDLDISKPAQGFDMDLSDKASSDDSCFEMFHSDLLSAIETIWFLKRRYCLFQI